jgi:esterase
MLFGVTDPKRRRLAEASPTTRLILPDLTGHGASPPLPPDAGLEAMAQDVSALIGHLGLAAPVRIIGHSLGGRVALATASCMPSMVGEVVLLDIAPGAAGGQHVLSGGLQEVLDTLLAAPAEAPSREAMRDIFLEAGIARALADWVTMNLVVNPQGVRWRIDRAALGAFNDRQFRTNLWDVVQVLGPRCLCVRGGRSAFVSDHTYAKFVSLGARVHTLPDAGHFVHVDSQAALIDILTQS